MLKTYLEEKQQLINYQMENFLNKLDYPKTISEGMKYSVLNGGKRIRPILLFMILDLYEQSLEKGYGIASAIEFIHSYSLVHDDLPALDNDDYRRGKLTTHKKFGEAEAILIGDALLTHSFSLITDESKDIEPEKLVKIVSKVSSYAGINGMIGGQMIDIESENKKIDFETLKYIHKNKTGKLLRLSVEIGLIISNAPKKEFDALISYSELIGLAFQIKDDILDVEGSFEQIGKPVGSDQELEKSTYPSIFGMEKSKELLKNAIEDAIKELENIENKNTSLLMNLAKYLEIRDK